MIDRDRHTIRLALRILQIDTASASRTKEENIASGVGGTGGPDATGRGVGIIKEKKGRFFQHRRKSAARIRGRDRIGENLEGLRATNGAKSRAAMPCDLTARGR